MKLIVWSERCSADTSPNHEDRTVKEYVNGLLIGFVLVAILTAGYHMHRAFIRSVVIDVLKEQQVNTEP